MGTFQPFPPPLWTGSHRHAMLALPAIITGEAGNIPVNSRDPKLTLTLLLWFISLFLLRYRLERARQTPAHREMVGEMRPGAS